MLLELTMIVSPVSSDGGQVGTSAVSLRGLASLRGTVGSLSVFSIR